MPKATTPEHIEGPPPEVVVPEPPKPAVQQPAQVPPVVEQQPEEEEQVEKPRRTRRGSTPPAPTAPPAKPVGPVQGTTTSPPGATVPQLAPMLTDEEQRGYDMAIDDLIARTQQNIARARSRSLNRTEKDMIARSRAFLDQAQRVRRQDPAAAKSLAERAELLSREVAGQ